MRKLKNNSKAILSAISLVFLGFAGMDAAAGVVEHHSLATLSTNVHAVSGHGILNRSSQRNRKLSQTDGTVAIIPVQLFAHSLALAGTAESPVISIHSVSSPRAASARAPPLS